MHIRYRVIHENDEVIHNAVVELECEACIEFAQLIERSAMPAEMFLQRYKLVLASQHAHHERLLDELRTWYFFKLLKEKGWPNALLMRTAELVAEVPLTHELSTIPTPL